MVFGSVGSVFIFYQKKNDMINYFFKLRLIGFGSLILCEEYKSITHIYTFTLHTGCSGPLYPRLMRV